MFTKFLFKLLLKWLYLRILCDVSTLVTSVRSYSDKRYEVAHVVFRVGIYQVSLSPDHMPLRLLSPVSVVRIP